MASDDDSEWEGGSEHSEGSNDKPPTKTRVLDVVTSPKRSKSRRRATGPNAITYKREEDITDTGAGAEENNDGEDFMNQDGNDRLGDGSDGGGGGGGGAGSHRRKRLRRVDFDAEQDDMDYMPSYQRITEAGGYMHTKNSRQKISQANKGKMPWNKGKNRSESAKAKISAGVRARNHALLLAKLAKLNLTEEEWYAKRKQIKLLRERVRKAKVAAAKHQQAKQDEKRKGLEGQLQALVQEIEVADDEGGVDGGYDGYDDPGQGINMLPTEAVPTIDSSLGVDRPLPSLMMDQPELPVAALAGDDPLNSAMANVNAAVDDSESFDAAFGQEMPPLESLSPPSPPPPLPQAVPEAALPTMPLALSIFARDIHWTPHVFDQNDATRSSSNNSNNQGSAVSYSTLCPNGGPGGLICCDFCTTMYAQYLTETVTDLETQKLQHVGKDVQELLDMTQSAKQTLAQTIKVARRKPMPMRTLKAPPKAATAAVTAAASATVVASVEPSPRPALVAAAEVAVAATDSNDTITSTADAATENGVAAPDDTTTNNAASLTVPPQQKAFASSTTPQALSKNYGNGVQNLSIWSV